MYFFFVFCFFFFRQLSLLSNFRQINCNNYFFPSISAMSLPQIHSHNFFSLLFRQYYCHKFIPTFFFSSISAILLPQTNINNFFSLLFWQCHCHIFIPTISPPPSISAMPLPQINCHFFFFFFLRNDMSTPFL